MTLVAALSGREGTILVADTEEIVADYAKRKIQKLVVQEGIGLRFGIAGASTEGTYSDMLQSEICASLCAIRDFDLGKIKLAIAEVLTNFYARHIWPRPSQQPHMQYLLVVQPLTEGYPTVIHISETAANICTEESKTIGIGSYLADYLFKQMTAGDLPFPPSESLAFLCAASVHVAREIRENIEGVGPLERVAVFNRDGTYDDLWPADIIEIEEAIGSIGEFLGYFYREALDGDTSSSEESITQWSSDISESLKKWYSEWQSKESRERRERVREMEKRRVRASGE
ncbi:MAG: hypothetical protein ACYDD2_16605 [Candidatus Acidiferrales bacterium]